MDLTYANIMQSALADNTRRAYAQAWARFVEFCTHKDYLARPADPSHVVEFLIEQATRPVRMRRTPLSMGTVVIYRSAINHHHKDVGLPSPTHDPRVENVIRGLTRIKGSRVRRVKALREHHIEAMVQACGLTPIGLRNAAIIAIGFAGALRRSELCALTVDDIEMMTTRHAGESQQMFITIAQSKTDQHGRGQKIAIPEGRRIKPIARLQTWLDCSGIQAGYVFQSMRRGGRLRGNKMHHSDIPRIVKYYAAQIGLDAREIAGHSLRAGFVTSAAVHNARLDKIMAITRHRNPATVLKYIRDADAFCDHAGAHFL